MERLVYRSTAADGVGTAEVFSIIETSARRNPAREITGFLIYDRDRFLQLVEGPTLSLEALMADLRDDPRHHSIDTLHRAPAAERWFPDWKMKRLISFSSEPAVEELRSMLLKKEGGNPVRTVVNEFLASK